MKLFDSHCHLHFPEFDEDREEIIKKLSGLGIKIINVGAGFEDSKKAVELILKYPEVGMASVGIHPHDAGINIDFSEFEKLAENDKVVAIGECGLDYYRNSENRELQKELFIKQIKLAEKLNKPLIIHCRPSIGSANAYEDALDIFNRPPASGLKNGVMHFFSGSKEVAKKFLDLGFYISFAGPITFFDGYKELVEFVSLEKILIETDAPFAAPAPHRGKRNEPAFVEFVGRRVAEWKNIDFETVARKTSENANNLFKINAD
jgi:TatD DNase family protein